MGWSPFRKTGLTHHGASASVKGYTLVTPLGGDATYLLDMDGLVVHRWRLASLGSAFYAQLLPNGRLLVLGTDESTPVVQVAADEVPPFERNIRRIGGNADRLLEYDWDGNVVWRYENQAIHHDFVRLPNGNTLLAEFTELPPEIAKAVRGGVSTREKLPPLISDDFIEVDAAGKERRRIHLWQLLDPRRDPICPLDRRLEWTHTNALDVNAGGDVLFSCRQNSRIGIVAASGDKLLWKYGAPNIHHQHHASFLRNGNVQVFDNGMHRIGNPRSAVMELNPRDNTVAWQFVANPEAQFFSAHISGAQRLAGDNVLVAEGAAGRVFEVTRRGEVVWEWITPFTAPNPQGQNNAWLFRALRYGPDYAGLAGRELDPAAHRTINRLYGLSGG
jgi:hypothetical protein